MFSEFTPCGNVTQPKSYAAVKHNHFCLSTEEKRTRGLGADGENIWIHGRPSEEVLKTQVSCELPGKTIFIMMLHLDKQNQV